MGWAQVWRSKSNPEYLLNSLNLASHAPGHVRGNGAVRNQQSFYEAFGIKEGTRCIYHLKNESPSGNRF